MAYLTGLLPAQTARDLTRSGDAPRWLRRVFTDPVSGVADGGETTRPNGQRLCEAHNLVKEMPGWRSRVLDH